jgi:hypothetical protein
MTVAVKEAVVRGNHHVGVNSRLAAGLTDVAVIGIRSIAILIDIGDDGKIAVGFPLATGSVAVLALGILGLLRTLVWGRGATGISAYPAGSRLARAGLDWDDVVPEDGQIAVLGDGKMIVGPRLVPAEAHGIFAYQAHGKLVGRQADRGEVQSGSTPTLQGHGLCPLLSLR